MTDIARNIEELLASVELENPAHTNEVLTRLNDIIRANESVRQQGLPDLFYSTLKKILTRQLSFSGSEEFWGEFELFIKCLKNSGAAFKSDVKEEELDICRLLILFSDDIISGQQLQMLTDKNLDNFKCKCFQFLLQYFFNLSQGNKVILKKFIDEWLTLSVNIINIRDINYDIHNLASMILVNSGLDKHYENILDKKLNSLSYRDLIRITAKVFSNLDYISNKQVDQTSFIDIDQEELEYLIDESNNNWSFRLVDYLYDNEANLNELLANFGTYDLIDRINILKVLKVKFHKWKKFDTRKKARLNSDFMELIINLYVKASKFFIVYLSELIQSPEFEAQQMNYSILIHMHLTELKHLAYCLSDILTVEHNSKSKSHIDKLRIAQSNEKLIRNTCQIFLMLYENTTLKNLFDIMKNNDLYSATHSNLKCELIRLIGILVYENRSNQNLVAELKVMELIAKSNLDMDICNPFVREWSLIALKHILVKNDFD